MYSAVGEDDQRIFLVRVHGLGDKYVVPELEGVVVAPRCGTALLGLGLAGEVDLVDVGHVPDFLVPEDIIDVLDNLVECVL